MFSRIREILDGLRHYDYVPPKIRPEGRPQPASVVVFPAESKRWEGIVWHHSFSKDNRDSDDWSGIMRYHTSYRVDGHIVGKQEFEARQAAKQGRTFEKPWSDIGYHGGVERSNGGELVWRQGRPWTKAGAHAGHPGNNTFNEKYLGLCVHPDQLIASDPVKRAADVSAGDRILGMSGWTVCTGKAMVRHSGDMVTIRPFCSPAIRLTCGHKVLAVRSVGSCSYGNGNAMARPDCHYLGRAPHHMPCSTMANIAPEWVEAGSLVADDIVFIPRPQPVGEFMVDMARYASDSYAVSAGAITSKYAMKKRYPRFLDSGDARFLGLYAAEGYSGRDVRLCFGNDENKLVDEARRFFSGRMGLSAHVHDHAKYGNASSVVIAKSKILSSAFPSIVGHGAKNKFFPNGILSAGGRALEDFSRGLLDGNGHNRRGSWMLATESEKLAFGMYIAATIMSGPPSFTVSPESPSKSISYHVDGIFPENGHSKRWFEFHGMYGTRIRDVSVEHYDGFVVDIGTMDGTFSCPIVAHNCAIGNFDQAAPDAETWEFCLRATREIMRAFGIPREKVLGHRETYALAGRPQGKSCPGNLWDMGRFRGEL